MTARTAPFLASARARAAAGAMLGWTTAVMVAGMVYPAVRRILAPPPDPRWDILIVIPLIGVLLGAGIGHRFVRDPNPPQRGGRDVAAHVGRAILFGLISVIGLFGVALYVAMVGNALG